MAKRKTKVKAEPGLSMIRESTAGLAEHSLDNFCTALCGINRNGPSLATKEGKLTVYAIAKRAGVLPEQLYRFISDERDLRFETALKVAEAMGLVLVPAKSVNWKGSKFAALTEK